MHTPKFFAILLSRKAKKSGCAFIEPPRRFSESLLVAAKHRAEGFFLFIGHVSGAFAPVTFLERPTYPLKSCISSNKKGITLEIWSDALDSCAIIRVIVPLREFRVRSFVELLFSSTIPMTPSAGVGQKRVTSSLLCFKGVLWGKYISRLRIQQTTLRLKFTVVHHITIPRFIAVIPIEN